MSMAVSPIAWEELLSGIRKAFSSERVDIDGVKALMSSYHSRREDWQEYALFDAHKYTRNLVDEGNCHYNVLIVCWGEGHASSIHDHANSHCFMRVMEGKLDEVLYAWPDTSHGPDQPVRELRRSEVNAGDVTYISDSIGLHRIENPSHTDPAVSLHIYCPPITICHTYEERTGHAHTCSVSFYSKNGQICHNYRACT